MCAPRLPSCGLSFFFTDCMLFAFWGLLLEEEEEEANCAHTYICMHTAYRYTTYIYNIHIYLHAHSHINVGHACIYVRIRTNMYTQICTRACTGRGRMKKCAVPPITAQGGGGKTDERKRRLLTKGKSSHKLPRRRPNRSGHARGKPAARLQRSAENAASAAG